MNINNGIINSSGISLGNLELASEYLYGDSTLYEPELTDIKQHINTNTEIKEPTRKEIHIKDTEIDERFRIDLTLDLENREYITGDIDEEYGIGIWNTDGNSDEIELNKIAKIEYSEKEDISSTNKDKNNIITDIKQGGEITEEDKTHITETSTEEKEYKTLEFEQSEISYVDESEEYDLNDSEYDLDDFEYKTKYTGTHESEVKTNIGNGSNTVFDCNNIESYKINSKESNNNSYNKTSYNNIETQTKNKANKKEDNCKKRESIMDESIDSLIHKAEGEKKVETVKYNSNEVKYSELEVDKLAEYMRQFLKCNGVSTGPVDIGIVNNEFGSYNVNRLLTKCYIIKIGKGVTIGI